MATIIKSPNRGHVLVAPGYVKPMTSTTEINLLRDHCGVGLSDRLSDGQYDTILRAFTDPRAIVQADQDRFGHEKSYAAVETLRRSLVTGA